ncbi:Heparinase II/III-like protein [Liberibacter crescens BT-1]|uniref:Heparinase II/III-like protein n=2 Tax=Liberibacter crescens TaxID=1273132 RepID=L0EWJ5_LIBCB|nr:Heparinase II/III-like protein [Liberibacter crescens BT-1]AMC13417.1 heparinase [Liberibacter crescens]
MIAFVCIWFQIICRWIRVSEQLVVAPTDLRSIDPLFIRELLEGRFSLEGRSLFLKGTSPFGLEVPTQEFGKALHGFSWLRHFQAEPSGSNCAVARLLVNDWIKKHGQTLKGIAWTTEAVTNRIIAWLSHSPVIMKGADNQFYTLFMKSLSLHIRYLDAIVPYTPDGVIRLRAYIALAIASISIRTSASVREKIIRNLDKEIERQILHDGTHISRNPCTILELLLDFLPLKEACIRFEQNIPQKLLIAISRMYPALRFFRHKDGDLALFNGATSSLAPELVTVLHYDETKGNSCRELPRGGYQRLCAGSVVIIVDTGRQSSVELSQVAHSGCLSFEFSSGKHRFIINSGTSRFSEKRFQKISRITAAHSTVTLNDKSSNHFSSSHLTGPIVLSGVSEVNIRRKVIEGDQESLIATHDGYRHNFGLIHERMININVSGTLISGRDRLMRINSKHSEMTMNIKATARFHVHPLIKLMSYDSESVLLKSPDGEIWHFSSPSNQVLISEDIFFADLSGVRRSEQIEINFSLQEKNSIRWFFSRRPTI